MDPSEREWMQSELPQMTPSEFLRMVNQTLEYDFAAILVEGEVASYKESQGKWVFFDLKDEKSSVNCFMPLWNLRLPLEDGMRVVVRATPKVTKWGKFSLTVNAVQPVGEGSLKRAFEMLKRKLAAEGLFAPEKKRPIPSDLARLGVISSTGAAGYADFVKILNARWGGIHVQVAHTQVQGLDAPDQIIRALQYFNERGEVQAIAILRGGGSADDLAAFNDENLVRAVAASKIPVIAGIGHEVDESLVDLAADLRASTPSNAAELITPDRAVMAAQVKGQIQSLNSYLCDRVERQREFNRQQIERVGERLLARGIEPGLRENREKIAKIEQKIYTTLENLNSKVQQKLQILTVLNPEKVLEQGYAIVAGKMQVGDVVKITTMKQLAEAKILQIKPRKDENLPKKDKNSSKNDKKP